MDVRWQPPIDFPGQIDWPQHNQLVLGQTDGLAEALPRPSQRFEAIDVD
jgi:hypothetical protein